MERTGLFFDPLQGEDLSPDEQVEPADTAPLGPGSEHQDAGQADSGGDGSGRSGVAAEVGVGTRRHRPDPDVLRAQRRLELGRVQDDLKRMAQGFPVAVAPSRRDRAGGGPR